VALPIAYLITFPLWEAYHYSTFLVNSLNTSVSLVNETATCSTTDWLLYAEGSEICLRMNISPASYGDGTMCYDEVTKLGEKERTL
jgi:hypothetical protein